MYNKFKKGGGGGDNISLNCTQEIKLNFLKYYHYLIIFQIQIIGCTSFVTEGKKKHVSLRS